MIEETKAFQFLKEKLGNDAYREFVTMLGGSGEGKHKVHLRMGLAPQARKGYPVAPPNRRAYAIERYFFHQHILLPPDEVILELAKEYLPPDANLEILERQLDESCIIVRITVGSTIPQRRELAAAVARKSLLVE